MNAATSGPQPGAANEAQAGHGDVQLRQELETAHEELQVAGEEARAQQQQIRQLVEGRNLLVWQHERMLSVLPTPVLTTDDGGVVRSANAAAADLLRLRVGRLVGKPLASLVAGPDRGRVSELLTTHRALRRSFRADLTVVPRTGEPVLVEALATPGPKRGAALTWMLMPAGAGPDRTSRRLLDVPEALSRLAVLATTTDDAVQVVRHAAEVTAAALGGIDGVSVSMGHPLHPLAVHSSSRTAQTVDGAQVVHGTGPCVDAYEQRQTVVAADLPVDPRWAGLLVGVPASIRGVVAVPLQSGEDLIGTLSVYAADPDPDPELVEASELFAATVGAVVFEVGLKGELQALASDMQRAMTSRATIEQAKGVVMADRHCTPDEAFEHLVRLSSTTHRKLRDVAAALVEQASGAAAVGP